MKNIRTHSPTIEEDILFLQKKGKTSSLTIEEILLILSEKGPALIILFLCLPFCQPLQIPGLSTPFGLAIAFIGLKMAFGKYVWLPNWILTKKVTPQTLQKITDKTLWVLKKIHGWVYPRMTWLCQTQVMLIVNGLLISIMGLMLALPLPTPFSNLVAAWSIFFIGMGMLRDDGVFILIGYFVSLCSFAVLIGTLLFLKFIF